MLTNKTHNIQIVLIQLLVFSTCFEHPVFIIRKTICTCSFVSYVFHAEIKIEGYIQEVKCSPYRCGVALRMGRGIALLFHYRGTRRG